MYRPKPEDFDDFHVAACSVEPFPKPDHKAKKHSRPRFTEHYSRRASIDAANAWAEVRGREWAR
ncbi:hypothetical protein ABIA16_003842 [Sinorhizobium fredii]